MSVGSIQAIETSQIIGCDKLPNFDNKNQSTAKLSGIESFMMPRSIINNHTRSNSAEAVQHTVYEKERGSVVTVETNIVDQHLKEAETVVKKELANKYGNNTEQGTSESQKLAKQIPLQQALKSSLLNGLSGRN